MAKKCTDNDILEAFMKHTNYLNEELGVNPRYIFQYQPTTEEMQNVPISPMMNWNMYW